MTGTVQRLHEEEGFGFIKDDIGKEYFFHLSNRTLLADLPRTAYAPSGSARSNRTD